MTDPSLPDEPGFPNEAPDPAADTGRFQAFVDGADADEGRGTPVGVPFRLATLLAGLVALGVIVWLLFLL